MGNEGEEKAQAGRGTRGGGGGLRGRRSARSRGGWQRHRLGWQAELAMAGWHGRGEVVVSKAD